VTANLRGQVAFSVLVSELITQD